MNIVDRWNIMEMENGKIESNLESNRKIECPNKK